MAQKVRYFNSFDRYNLLSGVVSDDGVTVRNTASVQRTIKSSVIDGANITVVSINATLNMDTVTETDSGATVTNNCETVSDYANSDETEITPPDDNVEVLQETDYGMAVENRHISSTPIFDQFGQPRGRTELRKYDTSSGTAVY